jgi:hypothetical protein|tara:strand:- start:383 stop:700 length:318 start_codon:yes stop_codon:yes gene_type:complete
MAVAACPFKEERCFRPTHGKVASRCDQDGTLKCNCPTGLEKIDFRRISEAQKYGLYTYGKNEEYYSNDNYWRSLDCIHKNFDYPNGERLEYREDWSSEWGCYCNS